MLKVFVLFVSAIAFTVAMPQEVKGGANVPLMNMQQPVPTNFPAGGIAPVFSGANQPTIGKSIYDYPDRPTIRNKIPFDAAREAHDIHDSIKGVGRDNLKLVKTLSGMSWAQRFETAATYKALFGRDCLADVAAKYEGKHQDAIEYLFWPIAKMYAREYREAVRGIGTNEEALIEMTASLTPDELRKVAAAYQEKYEKKLEKDVKDDTSGFFRDLLLALLEGRQPDTISYPMQSPRNTAEALNNIGNGNWDKQKDTIRDIFCKRSIQELRHTFEEYERLSGHKIEDAIEREFKKDAKKLLLAIVQVVRNRPAYYAETLKKAVGPVGSKFEVVNRIIIGRSEIDLGNIKEAFYSKYNQSIHDFLKGFMDMEYWELMVSIAGYEPEHFKSSI